MLVGGGCSIALSIPVSIGMLVVGYLYEEDCKIEVVPFFLLLGGWILLIGSVLFLCVIDRLTKIGDVLVVLANLAFLIWSSVVIFGNFVFPFSFLYTKIQMYISFRLFEAYFCFLQALSQRLNMKT